MRPAGNETGVLMNSIAIDLRDVADLEARAETRPPALTRQLVDYWREQLAQPVAIRRRALDSVLIQIRSGTAARAALLPFALGDVDEDIVFRATAAYVGGVASRGTPSSATDDAVEWARRRLALNRGAVLAALLSCAGETTLERLLPLRLTLDRAELDTVRRRVDAELPRATQEFLQTWLELTGEECRRHGGQFGAVPR
jgi:hypothetical protein